MADLRLILAKGGNFDLQDTNGCTVTHIMVVFDNINVGTFMEKFKTKLFKIQMFDMATECGAAINIENRQVILMFLMNFYLFNDFYQGLTPLTTAAYLARMDMFFHIARDFVIQSIKLKLQKFNQSNIDISNSLYLNVKGEIENVHTQ